MNNQQSFRFSNSFVAHPTAAGGQSAAPAAAAAAASPSGRVDPQQPRAVYEHFHKAVLARHFAREAADAANEFLDTCRRVFAGVQQASKYLTNNMLQDHLVAPPAAQVGNALLAEAQTDAANVDRDVRNANRIALSVVRDGLSEDRSRSKALRQISARSFVNSEELVYVHVWAARREGRKFQHTLLALAQTRHALAMPGTVCVPHSVALAHHGRLVTVTWLVPLIDEAPMHAPSDTAVGALEDAWRAALGVGPAASGVAPPRFEYHAGADGRYYVVGAVAGSGLGMSATAGLGERTMDQSNVCRFEHALRDRAGVSDDYRAAEVHVEQALNRAALALGEIVINPDRLREAPVDVVARTLRDCGLNKQFMFRLRAVMLQTLQHSGDDVGAAGTMDLLDTEMIARTLKSVIEAHLLLAIEESDAPVTLASRLQIVNEIVAIFFRAPEFLQNTLMPLMRVKFRAAEGFTIHPAHLKLGAVARHLAERFAMTFDPKQRKFVAFMDDPIVLGCTARRAIDYAAAAANAAVNARRVHDLVMQSAQVLPAALRLPVPPHFSLAAKLAPASAAIVLAATIPSGSAASPGAGRASDSAAAAAGADRDFVSVASAGAAEAGKANGRQFYAGLAAYFSLRGQLLGADIASDVALLDNVVQREGNALGHLCAATARAFAAAAAAAAASAGPGSPVPASSSALMSMMEVEHIAVRLAECVRTSAEAAAMQSEAWTHVVCALLERLAFAAVPMSREFEKNLEVFATVRRSVLCFFCEVPDAAREVSRRQPDALLALAQSFPRGRQMPSLLLVAQFAQCVLQDEASGGNPVRADQDDCAVLQQLWDELIAPSVPMWLMVADACATDAAFEEALQKALNDDEAIALLQFVLMVGKVGHVQRLLHADKRPGITIDRRKALVTQYAAFFRGTVGPLGLEAKLKKTHEDVDRLIEPLR